MEAAVEGRSDDAVAPLRAHFERSARIIRDDPTMCEGREDQFTEAPRAPIAARSGRPNRFIVLSLVKSTDRHRQQRAGQRVGPANARTCRYMRVLANAITRCTFLPAPRGNN